MKNIYHMVGILSTVLFSMNSWADCTQSQNATVTLETTPSIKLHDEGIADVAFNSGLACTGVGALNETHMKYEIQDMPLYLLDESTGARIKITIFDTNKNPVKYYTEVILSEISLINLFTGPSNSVRFFIDIPAGQSIRPGNYTATSLFRVQWYYSVPRLAAIGIGLFHESPGFKRGLFGSVRDWGTGVGSSVNIKMTVTPDCRIVSNDVNFGTAPFAYQFEPVKTSLGVRCSVRTPYSVGLSDGQNYQNNSRNMKNGKNLMRYEIYKGNSTARWGSNGLERWSSKEASANPGVDDGITQQRYDFVTKILENDKSQLPAGDYVDNISIEVKF